MVYGMELYGATGALQFSTADRGIAYATTQVIPSGTVVYDPYVLTYDYPQLAGVTVFTPPEKRFFGWLGIIPYTCAISYVSSVPRLTVTFHTTGQNGYFTLTEDFIIDLFATSIPQGDFGVGVINSQNNLMAGGIYMPLVFHSSHTPSALTPLCGCHELPQLYMTPHYALQLNKATFPTPPICFVKLPTYPNLAAVVLQPFTNPNDTSKWIAYFNGSNGPPTVYCFVPASRVTHAQTGNSFGLYDASGALILNPSQHQVLSMLDGTESSSFGCVYQSSTYPLGSIPPLYNADASVTPPVALAPGEVLIGKGACSVVVGELNSSYCAWKKTGGYYEERLMFLRHFGFGLDGGNIRRTYYTHMCSGVDQALYPGEQYGWFGKGAGWSGVVAEANASPLLLARAAGL